MTSEKVRVVVGDDHPMFRDGVVRALVSSGRSTWWPRPTTAVGALELIRTHQPQVALLDYRMPGMDGAEVAAAVTRDELPTRVLLISAHDESAIVYNGAAGGRGRLPAEGVDPQRTGERCPEAAPRAATSLAPNLAAGLAGEIRRRNEPDVPDAQRRASARCSS